MVAVLCHTQDSIIGELWLHLVSQAAAVQSFAKGFSTNLPLPRDLRFKGTPFVKVYQLGL